MGTTCCAKGRNTNLEPQEQNLEENNVIDEKTTKPPPDPKPTPIDYEKKFQDQSHSAKSIKAEVNVILNFILGHCC